MSRRLLVGGSILAVMCAGSLRAAPGGGSLVDAVRNGDTAAVRALLRASADVNLPSPDGTTPLHWAVNRDDLEVVDLLIRAGADVKATNRYGVPPLSLACENGNASIVERLLSAGAEPNTALPEGESVLMTAARTGSLDAIKALLARHADVNARDARGQTALMWAAARNNSGAIELLVEAGADVTARTGRASRAPTPPATASPSTATQTEVSDFGAVRSLFTAAPPTGFTPLLFAVRAGNVGAVRALLDAGADVNDTLSDGESTLIVAAANAHWQLADLLLDRGADPNLAGAGWNALHQAVRERRPNIGFGKPGPIPTGTLDSINVIKKMIAYGVDVNARMTRNGMKDGQRNRLLRTGSTAFFLAAKNTDVEVMNALLAAGADPGIPNAESTTPLMVAAGLYIWNPGEDGGSLAGQEDEVLDAVRICIEHGNDVNAVDTLGYTALHGAAFRGVNTVVEYLVEKGARLDARNSEGWTPLAIANGLSYSDFYKSQPHTADLLRKLMEARGLSAGNQVVDPKICLDCLQTHTELQQAFLERERRADAAMVSLRQR
jgi:ankyrin repeat protein